ncbi:MAG: recombinase family protein [Gaiellaceae bacterium]
MTIDAYIRVSRIGGRRGESFISKRDQRSRIEAELKRLKLDVGEWLEDLDYSGANVQRPGFQRGLERIRSHVSDGMIVVKLDRFARSVVDAVLTTNDIKEAAGRFISVEEAIDLGTPAGELQFHIIAAFAQFELSRIRESWRSAVTYAVGRGVHVAAYAPLGYDRGADGRLSPNDDAPTVVELFERRARGESWGKLAAWLDTTGCRPVPRMMAVEGADGEEELVERPWTNWTRQSAQGIIRNRVYLGEVRAFGGDPEKAAAKGKVAFEEIVNPNAHPALVAEELWKRANKTETRAAPRDGSIAGQALLPSLVRCGACGHTMVITGRTYRSGPRKGTRVHIYYCRGRYSTGLCPESPAIDGPRLDEYVDECFFTRAREKMPTARALADDISLELLEAAVMEAEEELAAFFAESAPRTEAAKRIRKERLSDLEAELEGAMERLESERGKFETRETLVAGLTSGSLVEAWPTLPVHAKRRLLAAAIDHIEIAPSNGLRGHRAPPVSARATICWS